MNLPVVELNSTDTPAGIRLPAPALAGTDTVAGQRLPAPQLNGNETPAGIRLPTIMLTNAGPSAFAFVSSGGAVGGGSADIVNDPLNVVGSGGGVGGGAADVSAVSIAHYLIYAQGGAVSGGAADVDVNWREFMPSAGALGGGSAATAFNLANDRAGIVNVVLPLRTITGQIIPRGSASADITLPMRSFSAYIASGNVAALAQSLPLFTLQADTGAALSALLPALSLNAWATTGNVATLVITLPALAGYAESHAANTARLAVGLPALQLDARSLTGSIGRADLVLPALTLTGTVLRGGFAYADLLLPALTLAARAGHFEATLDLVLPRLHLSAFAQGEASGVFNAHALNLRTLALTQYEGYHFNSFAHFAGRYLAAGSGGITELAGDDDAGAPIVAAVRFGRTDFDALEQKRIERALIACRSSGPLIVRVVTDESEVYEYPVADTGERVLQQLRVKFGRGLRLKYWCFEIANPTGAAFDLDSLTVQPALLARPLGR